MKREELAKIYKEYNLKQEDFYKDKKRGFMILTKSGVEQIQYQNNIKVIIEFIVCDLDNVVIKASSVEFDERMGDFIPIIETTGSASKNNCRIPFLSEIAEKRALARCIIKTIGWTNVKGEEELKNQPNETLNKLK